MKVQVHRTYTDGMKFTAQLEDLKSARKHISHFFDCQKTKGGTKIAEMTIKFEAETK